MCRLVLVWKTQRAVTLQILQAASLGRSAGFVLTLCGVRPDLLGTACCRVAPHRNSQPAALLHDGAESALVQAASKERCPLSAARPMLTHEQHSWSSLGCANAARRARARAVRRQARGRGPVREARRPRPVRAGLRAPGRRRQRLDVLAGAGGRGGAVQGARLAVQAPQQTLPNLPKIYATPAFILNPYPPVQAPQQTLPNLPKAYATPAFILYPYPPVQASQACCRASETPAAAGPPRPQLPGAAARQGARRIGYRDRDRVRCGRLRLPPEHSMRTCVKRVMPKA